MKTIYIFRNGSVLRRISARLLLEKGRERIFEIPLLQVGRILIYGRTEVTAQTIDALLDRHITLYYVRRSGALKGKITSATGGDVLLRQRQYRLFTDERFSLPLARSLVSTKIHNMETVIAYLLHRQQGTAAACLPLKEARRKLDQCTTREELMGVEGGAARHYFQIYGSYLPEPFRFQIRSRRPAQDPANALLNLGYMTLLREVEAHLEAHQLDSYFGVLHTPQNGRTSLALDLLEEFRQPFIDIFVLKILNLGQIKPENFQRSQSDGVTLSDEGFRNFFSLYEEKMGSQDGHSPGLRKAIDDQVHSLKQRIRDEANYHNFTLELSPET